jgi:hypothetical protein
MKTAIHRTLFIAASAAAILSACSSSKSSQQSDLVQSVPFQRESLVANGDDVDWTKPLAYFDDKTGLSYTVSNDLENLYIIATSKNETTIQRVLRGGLTVMINSHGVKEESGAAGIVFPTGNRVQKGDKMLNDRPELQQNKHVALDAVQDYALFGFHDVKTPENFDYGKRNPANIELGIGLNNANELVYEVMVPLSSFLNKNEMINLNRKSIAVEFVLDNIPGQSNGRSGGGGGLSIGGGLGFGSFGSGGGMGISIGSGSLGRIGGGNRQGKPTKFWKELLLAKAPTANK